MRPMRWLASLATLWLVGCSRQEAPAGPPATIPVFCSTAMKPTMEKGLSKGPRATLEGYLQLPTMFTLCSDTCMFSLSEDAAGKGPKVSVSLKVGDGKNELQKLPKSFQASDVKLTTRAGTPVDLKRKVRLSGERGGEDDKSCYQRVERVEQ